MTTLADKSLRDTVVECLQISPPLTHSLTGLAYNNTKPGFSLYFRVQVYVYIDICTCTHKIQVLWAGISSSIRSHAR